MQTVSQTHTHVNPDPDVTDLLEQAHAWGHEDATEGNDQRPSQFFHFGSAAWDAYNHGYAAGCVALAVLTGEQRSYWLPEVTHG